MSDNHSFGFGNFLPGFDFLQNLTQGATNSLPQMPNMSSWVTPTVSVEELEKRISELKSVQFWLEQNSRALSATIQALEVQKMTLATLKGMNFSMTDMANAFTIKTPEAPASSKKSAPAPAPAAAAEASPAPGVIDPMQWWGALTQQFQQIAATAMTEASKAGATDLAAEAFKTATDIAAKGVQTVQEATLQAATAATAAGVAAQQVASQAASQATAPAKKTTTARKAAPSPAPEATDEAAAGAADAEADPESRKPPVRRTKAAR